MAVDELPETPESAQSAQPVPPMQPVQPIPPKVRTRGSSGTLVLALAALVAAGGIAFAAGRLTAPASAGGRGGGGLPGGAAGLAGASLAPDASLLPGGSFVPGGNGMPGGISPGGGQITLTGTVAAISGSTLTLTTESGQTVEVSLADATWHGQTTASAADATVGAQVQVQLSGGFGRNPGAGQAAGASAVPGAGNLSAGDVTILQP